MGRHSIPDPDDTGDRTVPVTVQSGCLEAMRLARAVPTYPSPRISTCGAAMECHPRDRPPVRQWKATGEEGRRNSVSTLTHPSSGTHTRLNATMAHTRAYHVEALGDRTADGGKMPMLPRRLKRK